MLATTLPHAALDEKRYNLTFQASIGSCTVFFWGGGLLWLFSSKSVLSSDCSHIPVRLLLFHVYFLENVGKPEGMTLEDVAQSYDAMYGMPSAKMKGKSCASMVRFTFSSITLGPRINAGSLQADSASLFVGGVF